MSLSEDLPVPTLRQWLEFGIFHGHCRFASLDAFRRELSRRLPLDESFADGSGAAVSVRGAAQDLVHGASQALEVSDASALSWCLGMDLTSIADAIEGSVGSDLQRVVDVGEAERAARDCYCEIGIRPPEASVSVVDRFPEPYQDQDWNAMAPDAEDEDKYGIEPGIYIKASRLSPVFTHILIAHELVHLVPAAVDPNHFPMGLEEGLADVLSAGYFASTSLGVPTAIRHLVHVRLGRPQPDLRTLYADSLQRAALLYRQVGLGGIAELLQRGREAIHDVERKLIVGLLDELHLDAGNWHPGTTAVLQTALEAYPRLSVVSPLSMWIFQHVETGRTFAEIARTARVSEDKVADELKKVADSPRLVLVDDSSVNLSNVQFYLEVDRRSATPTIRYDASLLSS